MRDQKRIPKVLAEVEEIWEKYPDQRLGQLLCNIGRSFGYDEPFYMEDDKIHTYLETLKAQAKTPEQ